MYHFREINSNKIDQGLFLRLSAWECNNQNKKNDHFIGETFYALQDLETLQNVISVDQMPVVKRVFKRNENEDEFRLDVILKIKFSDYKISDFNFRLN